MKIVIAPDKFKGSLTSFEVCDIVARGINSVIHDCEIVQLPLSDGGDGLSEIVSYYTKAETKYEEVLNPLFEPIQSSWLFSQQVAFIEMAKASGLQLLRPEQYNCALTSTYGTGQLIKTAVNSGAKEIIIGIGGSATNDGGIGMAAALGYKFLAKHGKELSPTGGNLIYIKNIDSSGFNEDMHIRYIVACDVKNMLCGENGATKMFAAQKGADAKMIEQLEEGMMHYAGIVKHDLGIDVSSIEGGGAAGGLGAGCVAFLGAEIISGIDLVLKYSNAEKYISDCDAVVTGEGKIDAQTLQGKLVDGVSSLGKKYGKKIIAVCGRSELSASALLEHGILECFELMKEGMSLEESIQQSQKLLFEASRKAGMFLQEWV
ncbi:MAG: glycerate kinase [Bacteroidetes bacterium]|nr:glycerate kinase [Bacteroidota bacterium]